MEKWMNRSEDAGMGARTRNTYRAAIMAFCNWCVETDRLTANPLDGLCKADVRSDRRRVRRALTEDEIRRLLQAARLRPVADYGRETESLPPEEKKGRSTWRYKKLTFDTLEEAYERGRETLKDKPQYLAKKERLGRERNLIYKTMVLTGLRKGELASITRGQLHLDDPLPHIELKAKDAKAGRDARIPLREDLVGDLREWVAEKLELAQQEAEENGDPIPLHLPLDPPLFYVPADMIKIFDRDLVAADIPKEDERGRTVDLHALRHTFGTHLSKNGVAPRTAQAAMRHSSLDLTMNVYTDPQLLDVAGAMEALPALDIVGGSGTEDGKAARGDGRETGTV
jgi:integrase